MVSLGELSASKMMKRDLRLIPSLSLLVAQGHDPVEVHDLSTQVSPMIVDLVGALSR